MKTAGLTGIAAALATVAAFGGSTWKQYDGSWDGRWDDPNHWTGGVPVPTAPWGEGSALWSATLPNQTATITFPAGDCLTTAYPGVSSFSAGKTLTLDGPDTRLLLPATDEDNYASNTGYFMRLNGSSNSQLLTISVSDKKAAMAYLTNFNFTVSATANTLDYSLNRGLFDFLDPTGSGTERTDTSLAIGTEALSGASWMDGTCTFTVRNGATLRMPKVNVGYGYSSNTLRFIGGEHRIRSLSYGQNQKRGDPKDVRVILEQGAKLTTVGTISVSYNDTYATATYALLRLEDGSALTSDAGIEATGASFDLQVVGGSALKLAGSLNWPTSTGTLKPVASIVDSAFEMKGDRSIFVVGADGRFAATNSTVKTAYHCQTRQSGEIELVDSSAQFLDLELGITSGDRRSAFRVKGESSLTTSAKASIGTSGKVDFEISGGTVTLPSIKLGTGSTGDGALILNGGKLETSQVTKGSGTGTLVGNGGTFVPTSTSAFVTGLDAAELGEQGLTVDSAYNQTLAQDFSSVSGVNGKLIFTGGKTLTVPEGRTVAATLVMKGGTTLNWAGQGLTGLVLGEAESAATLNYTLGAAPIAVAGDLVLDNLYLNVSGTPEFDTVYTVFTCTGDVDAEAWRKTASSIAVDATHYLEFTVADGAAGAKELQFAVRSYTTVPLTLDSGEETLAESFDIGEHAFLEVTVGEGAHLTLVGAVNGVSIIKKGPGALTLGAANTLLRGLAQSDGKVTVANAGALSAGGGELTGGTLEFAVATTLEKPFRIQPDNEAKAVIVKTDAAVTMPVPEVTGGAFVKRGTAALTLTAEESTAAFTPVGKGRTADLVSFPADGSVPVAAFSGLQVVEGELVFKGLTDGVSVTLDTSISVGINTTDCAADPKLTVDHLELAVPKNGWYLYNGGYLTLEGVVRHVAVELRNGATLTISDFMNLSNSNKPDFSADVLVDASTLKATTEFCPNWNDKDATTVCVFTNGAALYTPLIKIQGKAGANVFDNSVVAKNAEGAPLEISQWSPNGANFIFRNGTRLSLNSMTGTSDRRSSATPYVFTFDGATWNLGSENKTFDTPRTAFRLYAPGKGVAFDPPADVTWTFVPEVLDGGTVKVCGEGTLSLNDRAYGALGVGGTGTLVGCTLTGATIVVDVKDDWTVDGALCFDGTLPTGKVKVDLGFDPTLPPETDPQPIVVARYTGADPDVSGWKLVNGGRGVKGSFAAANGEIILTAHVFGMMILVR